MLLGLAACDGGNTAVTRTAVPGTVTPTPLIGVSLATVAPATVVVVQTTPTPLPTATATPTSTPIVYTIDAGDTLLEIALLRNVTVADIETLNPGIQANLLQIGQQIVLPPPATAVAQAAAGTPIPIQVEVVSLETVRTPVGSVWVLGEVANLGTFPVANVRLSLSLPTAGGDVALSLWAAAPVIPAGGKAPFALLVAELPELTGAPSILVDGGETVTNLGSQYLGLAVVETAVAVDEAQVQVRGKVINNGEQAAAQVVVFATYYDAAGTVVGYSQHTVDGELAVGAERPLAWTASPPGGTAVSAQFLALGQVAAATTNDN